MAIYKRGGVYWFEFIFNGHRVRETTKQGNRNVAKTMEAARRTQFAKGEVGLLDKEPVPTLEEFARHFESEIETVCVDQPETVRFYREKMRRLLSDGQLSKTRLDAIDERAIDYYKQNRKRQVSRYGRAMSVASVNRELATLRRLLRLAQKWKVLDRVPKIVLLRGEHEREFVLNHKLQPQYLNAAPQPLKDVATLILETGMRSGEAVKLRWSDVYLQPAVRAKFGYISVRRGKSKNAKRNLSLTARAAEMLKTRKSNSQSEWVFPGDSQESHILGTSLDHQHRQVRDTLKLSEEFVVHSLRHTMLTRLGEAGADAFTIMKIAGHSSVTVSQRYVHPTPEGMERAFERLENLNTMKFEEAEREETGTAGVPTRVPTVKKPVKIKSSQVIESKVRALSSVG